MLTQRHWFSNFMHTHAKTIFFKPRLVPSPSPLHFPCLNDWRNEVAKKDWNLSAQAGMGDVTMRKIDLYSGWERTPEARDLNSPASNPSVYQFTFFREVTVAFDGHRKVIWKHVAAAVTSQERGGPKYLSVTKVGRTTRFCDIVGFRRFWTGLCLLLGHYAPREVSKTVLSLKMGPAGSSETSPISHFTPYNKPEDGRIQLSLIHLAKIWCVVSIGQFWF